MWLFEASYHTSKKSMVHRSLKASARFSIGCQVKASHMGRGVTFKRRLIMLGILIPLTLKMMKVHSAWLNGLTIARARSLVHMGRRNPIGLGLILLRPTRSLICCYRRGKSGCSYIIRFHQPTSVLKNMRYCKI